ncbi:hypothetical protein MNEG_12155 [Monoraphidium neglectum]|uniref:Uncharacterized protein n=1 Tax=Monoraphidium neglectum TaxID=145388 RepID=A0A0D2MLX7_9CHLO|nr:hypothetical protein MNEG_12155 [Monoraphidium neglectum]KIY95805.1 hypothetical protein MNEG_12155 [Monoraphidium neglectum]|eukprot:XP_013894825.1 hypothetical protein MNEG_12155 [Monoraphidium neglectum]
MWAFLSECRAECLQDDLAREGLTAPDDVANVLDEDGWGEFWSKLQGGQIKKKAAFRRLRGHLGLPPLPANSPSLPPGGTGGAGGEGGAGGPGANAAPR